MLKSVRAFLAKAFAAAAKWRPWEKNKPQAKKTTAPRKNDAGSFYYFDDLLDRLGKYFPYMKGMKRAHPDMYKLCRRLGATVTSRKATYIERRIPPQWKDALPAFGAVMWRADEEHKRSIPFMGWQKVKQPMHVERANGQILHVYIYTGKFKKRRRIEGVYAYYVSIEGNTVRPLKEWIRNKYGGGYWGYPEYLEWSARVDKISVTEVAEDDFYRMASVLAYAQDGFRIRCQRGGITAAFNIDITRTPYFFRGRDKTVTNNGKTKKIFHIVRTHERKVAGGKKTVVRSHFRGLRKFNWKGYAVTVSMPGYHHKDWQNAFDISATDIDERDDMPAGFVGAAEMGKILLDHEKDAQHAATWKERRRA